MNLFDIKKEQKAALDAAETILKSAETSNRGLTVSETEQYNTHMNSFRDLGASVPPLDRCPRRTMAARGRSLPV